MRPVEISVIAALAASCAFWIASGGSSPHTRNAAKQAARGEAKRAQHQTIKRVTEEIATLKYNTTVAALMEYLNALEAQREQMTRPELQTLLLLLAPFAPFLTEELWEYMGNTFSIHKASW